MKTIRTHSELVKLPTFVERFRYLQLDGRVGINTFGYDRYLNQGFYHSGEWRRIRDYVITRDFGRDLGMEGYEIFGKIYIHHMNPISAEDVVHASEYLAEPEFLICTTHNTHNAIHYGDESLLMTEPKERTPFDTCPWKRR